MTQRNLFDILQDGLGDVPAGTPEPEAQTGTVAQPHTDASSAPTGAHAPAAAVSGREAESSPHTCTACGGFDCQDCNPRTWTTLQTLKPGDRFQLGEAPDPTAPTGTLVNVNRLDAIVLLDEKPKQKTIQTKEGEQVTFTQSAKTHSWAPGTRILRLGVVSGEQGAAVDKIRGRGWRSPQSSVYTDWLRKGKRNGKATNGEKDRRENPSD